jgi:lipopolysaccharide cholinephosphotransferase
MKEVHCLQDQIEKLEQQNEQLSSQLSEFRQMSLDAHTYEQHRDMMMYWQIFKRSGETLEETKKRFFRGLPKATGLSRLFQDAEIKLFQEFNDFCKLNNIQYWTCSGTMLGAYLYHGMIPWDDDIDVFITRPDLSRMQKLLEASTRFRITVVWDWCVPCKQIRFRLADNNNPTFIDLFPLDLASGDPTECNDKASQARADFVKDIRETFSNTSWPSEGYLYNSSELTNQIEALFERHQKKLVSHVPAVNSISKTRCLIRGIENIDEIHSSGPYPLDEWVPIIPMKYGPFEVPMPNSWRQYLTRLYGDYLQIPHDIDTHEHIDNKYLARPESVSALKLYLANNSNEETI